MRRSAANFTVPVICAVLAVVLIGAIGKAEPATGKAEPTPARANQSRLLVTASPAPIVRLPQAKRDELLYDLPRAHAVVMEVTAYCACPKCCGPGARGLTASGRHVKSTNGTFVAADTSILPFHTKLIIPGYAANRTVEVLDRGGAIKGRKLDVYFPTHQEALNWGRKKMEVIVME